MNLLRTNLITMLLAVCGSLMSQNTTATLNFTLDQHPDQKIWLYRYYATDRHKLDSTTTDSQGKGSFILKSTYDIGMYRIQDKTGEGIDFLNFNKDIQIISKQGYYLKGIEVEGAQGNKDFFTYLKARDSYSTRIDILGNMMVYYPPDDSFYYEAEKHYLSLSAEYNAFLRQITTSTNGTLLGTIIAWDQLPDIDPSVLPPEQKNILKETYFDAVYWGDSLVLYTPLLPVKIIDYLSLYVEPGASKEKQEQSFTEAIDRLVEFASLNADVKEAVVNYLIQGFQAYGYENIITHIVETYIAGKSCVSDQEEAKLVKRVEGFKQLAVGNQAADISLPDLTGKNVTLSLLGRDYYLVVFWASWCPHCTEMLPVLDAVVSECAGMSAVSGQRSVVGEGKSLEAIYVSIDTNSVLWQAAVKEKELGGIHLSDLKGWDSKAARDYFLYATPTLLILDKNLKIISKPAGIQEVKGFMVKEGLCR